MKVEYVTLEWVHRDIIGEEIARQTRGNIFFFRDDASVCAATGIITRLEDTTSGIFIILDSGEKIRADRVITLFGKPGSAFDAYNDFANACMDCTEGYDLEQLN